MRHLPQVSSISVVELQMKKQARAGLQKNGRLQEDSAQAE
jgi:hypothetical protein